jgi:aspartate aminotransferase
MKQNLAQMINPALRGMSVSPALRLSERVDAMRGRGIKVHKLALGQSPFPVPERMILALQEAAYNKDYAPTRGLPALRKAIAGHVQRRLDIDRTEDDVLVGPGSKDLLFLLLLAFDGELILPTPGWSSYGPQARLLHKRVITIHADASDGYLLTPSKLDEALSREKPQARMLVLSYPSNPTGLTYRSEDLRELARVARKHNLLVLSDEVYGELHHKGQHTSLARHYAEGTIISTGLSKWVGAGGWRLGCFVFPDNLRPLLEAMAVLGSETFTATSTPVQFAGVVAFDGGEDVERYLFHVRRILSALARFTTRRLQSYGVRCAQPAGGLYVFADFAPVVSKLGLSGSAELCERILEQASVALVPGEAFGRPKEELTARIAFVDFDGPRALNAVSVIPREQPVDETFLRRHCAPMVEAIEALGQWIAKTNR